MSVKSIDDIQSGRLPAEAADQIAFADSEGRVRIGSLRLREVRCGKENCKKCPHKIYAYARYRDGKKVKEKYLGVMIGDRVFKPSQGSVEEHSSHSHTG